MSELIFEVETVTPELASALLKNVRNKGRIDHLKDPMPAISYIVSRAETEDLMVHYCLPAFARNDADAFLMGVARANALIKKVGANSLRTQFVPN